MGQYALIHTICLHDNAYLENLNQLT